jgi:hypothetical protein
MGDAHVQKGNVVLKQQFLATDGIFIEFCQPQLTGEPFILVLNPTDFPECAQYGAADIEGKGADLFIGDHVESEKLADEESEWGGCALAKGAYPAWLIGTWEMTGTEKLGQVLRVAPLD